MKHFLIAIVLAFSFLKSHAQVGNLSMFCESISWQISSITALNTIPQLGITSQVQQIGPGSLANRTLLFAETQKGNNGFGVNYYGDFFDMTFQHALQGHYSRKLQLNDDMSLAFGTSLGAYLYQGTFGTITEREGYGIYQVATAIKYKNLLVAYSLGRKAWRNVGFSQNIYATHRVKLSQDFFLDPLFHLFWVTQQPYLQTGLRLSWKDWVDVGLIYQSENGTNLTFGLNLFKNIRLGYAVVGLNPNLFTQYSQEFLIIWRPGSSKG